jgi:hypothetical protein
MVIRWRPRERGLRRASGSVRPTRGCASSMCARRGSRRAQAAMEVDGAMSSPRRHQWWTAELGGGVRAREAGGRGWFIYGEVGWELVGHSRRSAHARCGRQRLATCKHPDGQWRAAGYAPASAVSPLGAPSGRGRHAQEHVDAAQRPAGAPVPRRAFPSRVRRVRWWPMWPLARRRDRAHPALQGVFYLLN